MVALLKEFADEQGSDPSAIPCAQDEQSLRVLVLDDDAMFLRHLRRLGRKNGLLVSSCRTVAEFAAKSKWGHFDVAVIDYYLEDGQTGVNIAQKLQAVPVLLVSQSGKWTRGNEVWPLSVRAFVNKKQGVEKIIDTAMDIGFKNRS